MQGARDRVGRFMSWCVIAGEVCDLFVACSQAVAVRSETRAGVASVGIGQAVAVVGPTRQLLPTYLVGGGVLDRHLVGEVFVAVASLLD